MKVNRGMVAGLFALLAAPSMTMAGEQDFNLINKTGIEIHALYVSPADQDEWGDDILGEDTLPNGDEVEITFDRKEKAALWDLRIEDENGGSVEWEKLKLVEIAQVTLHYDKKTRKATAKIEKAEAEEPAAQAALDFEIVNKTGVEIHALHVSPSDKDAWGKDILGRATMANGAQGTINFSPTEKAELWDLRVEDEDGNAIEWTELDLTEISKLTLLYNKESGKATAKIE